MGSCKNWIGDEFFDGDRESEHVSLKPLLGKMISEAFRMAVCDSMEGTDERRVEVFRDIYKISNEEWGGLDPMAIAKNLKCRLLGMGGWTVRGVYSGNASAREVFDACYANSDLNEVDRTISDLREAFGPAPQDGGKP